MSCCDRLNFTMLNDSLTPIIATRKTGQEPFHSSGHSLPFDLLSFWQWSASDLMSNALRGRLAEFLVGCALGIVEGVRAEWDAYDLRTADGTTIEVKSAAYVQTWTQRKLSTIQFDIAPTRYWNAATNVYESDSRRQADVYVFALLAHQDKATVDPFNVDQWRFFVLPTGVLNSRVPAQRQIRLSRLVEIGAREYGYAQLQVAIADAVGLKNSE